MVWLLGKLWRLSQRKTRWRNAALKHRQPHSGFRSGRRTNRKE
ncbi:high mobility group protein Z [Enterobacillus tribolii]|nr:high mobility group protein Z [Enterobacillus tribolii]